MPTKLRVVFFTESAQGACSLYRAWIPCLGLNLAGHHARYSQKWYPQMLDEFDIFIFQRNSVKATVELIYAIRQETGKPVIFDLDDNIMQIPMTNPAFWLYLDKPEIGWYQLQSLMVSSCGTYSTQGLAKRFGVFKPAHVLPNYLNIEEHRNVQPIRVAEGVLMFWGGSNTHRDSLELLKDVIPEVFKRHPEAKLVVMGSSLPFEADPSRVIEVPWGLYKFFKAVLLGCDIGLAPLAPGPFSECKSDLRIKELAAGKLAIVASDYAEYGRAVREAGGIPVSTTEEWVEALSRLIGDGEERKYRGELAWAWAQKQDIRCNIQERIELYQRILEEEHFVGPRLEELKSTGVYQDFAVEEHKYVQDRSRVREFREVS